MVDYAEIICQAVDEIVSKRLESINYDNTITCSIIDASKAKTGTYIVSDGSINFTAYSVSTEYKVNDVVYVTVPNNDFTRQKIIIGKQVTKDTTPFIFTTPFDTIVDVSTNLITENVGMRSLIANNPDDPEFEPDDENSRKLVWERDFEDSMVVGFTRLGIQGQFRSWLKSYSAKDGDYGYHLILTCEKDSHETTIQTAKRVINKLKNTLNETIWGEIQTSDEINWPDDLKISWAEFNREGINQDDFTGRMVEHLKTILINSYAKYDLYLSSHDMYGDPYNFQSFYQQEKVFDISGLGKIIKMRLEFYQTPETFIGNKPSNQNVYDMLTPDIDDWMVWDKIQKSYDWPKKYQKTKEEFEALSQVNLGKLISDMRNYLCLIPYEHPLFGTLMDPNLFDKDPYICVGYDIGSFSEEQLVMYTLDSSTYRAGLTDEENTKQVQLRWIHEFEDGTIKAISNETDPDFDFEVRWYQQELGHPTIDGYAGVNWKRVNQDEHIEVDLSKISNNIKNYYLIYHTDKNGTVHESTYATGLKVPYKNGRSYTLKYNSTTVLSEVDSDWLKRHSLDVFERKGFINPNYGMTTINVNLDLQSWTNIFQTQCIFHDAHYNSGSYTQVRDSFTGASPRDIGCLHRVGFWELFTMGYIMYQYCPNEYDQLRVDKLWKTGGTKSEEWTKKYANRNLFKDLGFAWPGNGSAASGMKKVLEEFAASFGEWHWYEDPEDGWRDYRPVDEEVYATLYQACSYLYEKTQRPEYDYIAPNFSYTFLPDIEEAEEKVKAVIIYDDKPIYSNILTFTNERYVSNPSTLDQLNGLNLWCADDSYGNYRIYNIGGYLEDEDQRNHIRDLECHFNPKESGVEGNGLLHEANWIMWRIPASNSMIELTSTEYPSNLDYNKLTSMPEFKDMETIAWKYQVPFSISGTKYFDGTWSEYMYDKNTDEIVSIWKGNSANGYFINPLLEYKIKNFYSPSYSNNTIKCTIYKNGVQYETQKEFTFGPAGNSGTDWSFEIDIDNNETALTSGNEKTITLTARLYDQQNRDVTEDILYDADLNANLTWSWHEDTVNPTGLKLVNGTKKYQCSISVPSGKTIDMNSLLYVKCETVNVGDYTLTAVLPIPIRKWVDDQKHYSHVTGATHVVYPSSGYPNYYNNPFKVHITEITDTTSLVQSIEKGGSWKLFNPHNESKVYVGNISDKNILKPAAIYTNGVKQYGLQYSYNGTIYWTQPIFTMQNNYPSRALNKWDGKEIRIDYDNGTIIAPAIAAGKKNADNTFSGVMLGDWSGDDAEADVKQQTGIYGFDKGAMSYAFKEDGTAFIGKSGFARLKFDGNESTIASEGYLLENYGMLLDFDDGFIDILGGHQTGTEEIKKSTDDNWVGYNLTRKTFETTGARVQLGISGDPYFKVIADTEHKNTPMIEISNDSYYLQTWDFNKEEGKEKGMRLDLMDTSLIAYNFTLESTGYGVGYDPAPKDGETSTRGQIHIRLSTEDQDYFFIGKNAQAGDKDSSVETIKGVRIKPLIKINEGKFLLQSYNFGTVNNKESGMQIDLNNGSINAYNFTLESKGEDDVRIRLSTEDSPWFLISKKLNGIDKSLIEIGDGTFFLQSYNFSDEGQEKGTYIDLENGSIYAYNFTLETSGNSTFVRLSSMGEPYFQISTKEDNGKNLIYIGSSSYYLQSKDYSESLGMKIDLNNGEILAHKFTLSANGLRLSTNDDNDAGYFHIEGKDENGKEQTLIHIGTSSYYLQSVNYIPNSSGMHINLADGKIDAYNFTLTANGGNGSILIDSAGDVPLKIGQKFQVSWDGVMTSDGAVIRTATIDDANVNRGTITSATINTATINDATINTATLTGEIKGHSGAWSINSSGVANFSNGTIGCFDFNDTVLSSNTSNASLVFGNSRIRAYSGDTGLALSGGRIYLQGDNGTSVSNGLYLASGGITSNGKLKLPSPSNVTFGETTLEEWLETTYNNGYEAGEAAHADDWQNGWDAGYSAGKSESSDSSGGGDSTDPGGNGGAGSE